MTEDSGVSHAARRSKDQAAEQRHRYGSCRGGGPAGSAMEGNMSGDKKASAQSFLGVRAETLAKHGAVSEAVAREMAEGIRTRTRAVYALSVTGIAGPSGGTPEKPVGTVFIGLASPERTQIKRLLNEYERETFKFVTSQQALDLLRRELLSARE